MDVKDVCSDGVIHSGQSTGPKSVNVSPLRASLGGKSIVLHRLTEQEAFMLLFDDSESILSELDDFRASLITLCCWLCPANFYELRGMWLQVEIMAIRC